jgi:hypothetical protein
MLPTAADSQKRPPECGRWKMKATGEADLPRAGSEQVMKRRITLDQE